MRSLVWSCWRNDARHNKVDGHRTDDGHRQAGGDVGAGPRRDLRAEERRGDGERAREHEADRRQDELQPLHPRA